jgi:hypothetical protein
MGTAARRTWDPSEADLYYIPTLLWYTQVHGASTARSLTWPWHPGSPPHVLYPSPPPRSSPLPSPQGNTCGRATVRLLSHYVRAAHPYWARSGGRDHLFFLPSDGGGCWFDGELGARPILLSHWGLLGGHGAMAKTSGRRRDFASDEVVHRWMGRSQYCHSPHKDIVVPPYAAATDAARGRRRRPPEPTRASEYSLLHAGGIWQFKNYKARENSERWYSQGVRQALYDLYGAGRTGGAERPEGPMRIYDYAVDAEEWLRPKFCLSASGMGWGIRTGMLLLLGCVPLVAQPYVVQPLEPQLPFQALAMRVDRFGKRARLELL